MNGDPRLRRAGFLLGVGLGGFVDGILLHQVLQLHNMVSARVPKTTVANVEVGMFWDGIFHVFTWAVTLAGVVVLWRAYAAVGAGAPGPAHALAADASGPAGSGRTLLGAALVGWGVFNLAEGLIDHHLLELHHVVENLGPSPWDLAFLGSGVVLAVAGWLVGRSTSSAPARTSASSAPPPRP